MSKYKRMSLEQAIYMPGALLGMTNSTALFALSSSRFMLLAFPSHSGCVGKVVVASIASLVYRRTKYISLPVLR